MTGPTPDDLSELRLKVVEVEFRAKSDEAYLERLRADPVGVLQTHGFDDPMAERLASELRGEYATEASEPGCPKCDPFTCIITGCCFFTTLEPTTLPEA